MGGLPPQLAKTRDSPYMREREQGENPQTIEIEQGSDQSDPLCFAYHADQTLRPAETTARPKTK
jgi:hypothetical protein